MLSLRFVRAEMHQPRARTAVARTRSKEMLIQAAGAPTMKKKEAEKGAEKKEPDLAQILREMEGPDNPSSYSRSQRSECARPRRPTINYHATTALLYVPVRGPCSTPSLGPRLQPKPRGVRTGSCRQHGSNPTRQSDLPGPLTLLR